MRVIRNSVLGALLPLLLMTHQGLSTEEIALFDPALGIQDQWVERSVKGHTQYEPTTIAGRKSIRATAIPGQASGLYRRISFNVVKHPVIEWSWRVDALQDDADIRTTDKDDFAAAIFFIFASRSRSERATALAYVWTSSALPRGTFVRSPRHTDSVRFIVVESGSEELGRWLTTSRNLRDDYHVAFGTEPTSTVESIALWTDADQTKQTAVAFYGPLQAGEPHQ